LRKVKTEFEQERKELLNGVSRTSRADDSSSRIQKLEQDLSHWQRVAKLLRKEKQKLELRAQTLASELEEGRVKFPEQLASVSVSPSEQILVDLKRQDRQLREMTAQCNEAIEQREEQIRELFDTISQLKSENHKLKQDLVSQKDEIARERQLYEAKSKALCLQIQTEFQSKLEDVRAQHEGENRRVVGFVVKRCPELFAEWQQFTGDCLEVVLQTVIRSYMKLKESETAVRRLLSISAVESVEEAVAKVLLV
jgi:chromosome segregation ATPase